MISWPVFDKPFSEPFGTVHRCASTCVRWRRAMERVAEVAVQFEFAAGATISFGDPLELALDCPICRRCRRTVVFREKHTAGKCTPTGHSFPGQIIAKEVAQSGLVASIIYRVMYIYELFIDVKYPEIRESSGEPTWGRVAFGNNRGPQCGHVTASRSPRPISVGRGPAGASAIACCIRSESCSRFCPRLSGVGLPENRYYVVLIRLSYSV